MTDALQYCLRHPREQVRAFNPLTLQTVCFQCDAHCRQRDNIGLYRSSNRYAVRTTDFPLLGHDSKAALLRVFVTNRAPIVYIRRRLRGLRGQSVADSCPACGGFSAAAQYCSLECAGIFPEIVNTVCVGKEKRTNLRKQKHPRRAPVA